MKRVFLCSCLVLLGCDPVTLVGGGATLGTMASRKKGVSGAVLDSKISLALKAKIYNKGTNLHSRVSVNVQNGEVLLTGQANDIEDSLAIERLAWDTDGVLRVMNEIDVGDENSLSQATSDAWITTRIKTSCLFKDDVRSMNYSIKTTQGVVYIMGVAENEVERDQVVDLARSISGVKKVLCYVKLAEPT